MGLQEVWASPEGRYAIGYCIAMFVPIALAMFLLGVNYANGSKRR